MKVLITGISGGLGRLLSRRLVHDEHEVCGVEPNGWPGAPQGVRVHKADLRKRGFEDVLRTEKPDAVVHLGFVRHFKLDERTRHDINVRGTKRLLDHCVSYRVKKLVVVSSSYVYGALPENPYLLDEDAPLSASRVYPEIRDLVELDSLAAGFLWRYPEVETAVLRPVNVLGHYAQSMAGRYLRQARVPTVMGFDPMMQFIHEDDLCAAIETTLEGVRGVYNVVGSGEVPVSVAIEQVGARAWPVPEPLLRTAFGQLFEWGLGSFPPGMLNYLKYPVTLSGERFAEATGFQCGHSLREIFETVKN